MLFLISSKACSKNNFHIFKIKIPRSDTEKYLTGAAFLNELFIPADFHFAADKSGQFGKDKL